MTDVYGSLGCLAVCLFTGNDADGGDGRRSGGGGGGNVGDGALWAKMCARLRIEGLPYIFSFHIAQKPTYVSNNFFLHIFRHCMLFSRNSDSFLLNM